MDLELRHLRVLCTIAEAGSLTRAAAALGMSQPGLTAQLKRIERMLGGRLFVRQQTGVQPTPLGEIVLARARAVLPAIEDLLLDTALSAARGPERERFRLGSVNAPLLGGMISSLRSIFSTCEITSRTEGSSPPLIEHVAAGRLELAVAGDSPGFELAPRPGVVLHVVATEPVFVILPAAHRLAGQSEVALADLADDDWALPRPDDDRIREYWAAVTGYRMRVPYEAEGRLVIELVRMGHALSFCQATFEELSGLVVRPIAGNPMWYRHIVAWHQEGPLAPHGAALAQAAAETHDAALARSRTYREWRDAR